MNRTLTRFLAAALLTGTAATPAWADAPTTVPLNDGWQARIDPTDTDAAAQHPGSAQWFAAAVPGSVQQDLIANGTVPDPFIGTNEGAIQWVGLTDWEMRRTLQVDAEMMRRGHLDLVFEGLDTFATVFINGQQVLEADNGHRHWRVAAKPFLREGANEILIRFKDPIGELQPMVLAEEHPLPGEYDSAFGDEPKGVQTSPYIRKAKYHYGWDWGPRIINIGINRAVRLEAWDDARLASFEVVTEAIGTAEARLQARFHVEADAPGRATFSTQVTGPDGRRYDAVAREASFDAGESTITVPLTITDPQRWWPVGYGEQPLYQVAGGISRGDGAGARQDRTIGLREVELIQGDGAFGFRVNGVTVFAKGANIIPFDSFPARVTDETMVSLLEDSVAANMNMIRVWGGGYYYPRSFYDAADRLGLMIWQDFMFGGAVPPPDVPYRQNVAEEAQQQVERLGNHPSIVGWTGGNEVLSGWENWSDRKAYKTAIGPEAQAVMEQSMTVLFDRVLRQAVTDHSPGTTYWPGSPSTGYQGPVDSDAAGDRHFWDVWSGSKPVENYTLSCPRFMSEYGFQSMPDMATIREFAGEGDLALDSPVLKAHQKFLAGEGNERLRLYLDARLRPARDFADLVYLTQVNQMQAIELAARHHRACAPVTLGSLYWQLNDVWPAISWASVDYHGRWKLLHHAARRFFAPQIVIAEHGDGATQVSFASDAVQPMAAEWRLTGYTMDGTQLGQAGGAVTLAPTTATQVDAVSDSTLFATAEPPGSYAVAELLVGGDVVSRQIVERALPKDMAYPAPGLTARWNGKSVTVTAERLARVVMLDFGTVVAAPADDGFDLLPGESRTIEIESEADVAILRDALVLRSLAGDA